jgi:hypothetical protein
MAESFEVEEFWDDLLAYIEDKRVIPVIGAELLTIEEGGTSLPLYREVAERLLNRYGLSAATLPQGVVVRDGHEINDAVCALAAKGRRVKDLYRPVHDILEKLLQGKEPPEALRQLSSIRDFDLFVTTTPDDLLARALDAERFNGASMTDQIEHAPKLPTDRQRDIPELPPSNYTAVFYIFGKANVSQFYAIHDEDSLEFPYSLQAGNGPERMFSQLRSRNLLLIGCTFADWLGRLFLRLSNVERLFSDQRTKKEFLVGHETATDFNFTVFLERFSQDTRCYPVEARTFIAELYRRWHDRNPVNAALAQPSGSQQREPAGEIFISYASEDVAAAKKIFTGIDEIGGGVAWFDKSALKSGDEWNQQILSAVKRCSLFLPLLSTTTERRTDGYFRREWNEAAERSKAIQGRKFTIPIVIDPDFSSMDRYALVPENFRAFQYSHAPAGQMTDELKGQLREQLRNLRRARAV